MSEGPTTPEFWNQRYATGRIPWDQRGVPAAAARFLAKHPGGGARVLLPGCGSGHEIAAFDQAGYAVVALDFSLPAVTAARAALGSRLATVVHEGDFFTHPLGLAAFDLVYERTFLCALPPHRWPAIAARVHALLKPGGLLTGIFYFGGKEDGPPFGFAAHEALALFSPSFDLIVDDPIPPEESLPIFAGGERWQEWRRR